MENNPVIQAVVKFLESSDDIEGAFVFGSLVNQRRDAFSDVEIGIVSKHAFAVSALKSPEPAFGNQSRSLRLRIKRLPRLLCPALIEIDQGIGCLGGPTS